MLISGGGCSRRTSRLVHDLAGDDLGPWARPDADRVRQLVRRHWPRGAITVLPHHIDDAAFADAYVEALTGTCGGRSAKGEQLEHFRKVGTGFPKENATKMGVDRSPFDPMGFRFSTPGLRWPRLGPRRRMSAPLNPYRPWSARGNCAPVRSVAVVRRGREPLARLHSSRIGAGAGVRPHRLGMPRGENRPFSPGGTSVGAPSSLTVGTAGSLGRRPLADAARMRSRGLESPRRRAARRHL